jgi:hypothetical protein
MYTREVISQFDQDIEVADAVLSYGARNSPDIVTPEREAELRHALGLLYLPNINAAGEVTAALVSHPSDRIPYLPYAATEFVSAITVQSSRRSFTNPIEYYAGSMAVHIISRTAGSPEVCRDFPYVMVEGKESNRTDPHKLGGAIMHELTHTRQSFRAPSMRQVPPILSGEPVLHEKSQGHTMKKEAEANWIEYEFLTPETKAKYDNQYPLVDRMLTAGGSAKGIARASLWRYLIASGRWSAESEPTEIVQRLLVHTGIV